LKIGSKKKKRVLLGRRQKETNPKKAVIWKK